MLRQQDPLGQQKASDAERRSLQNAPSMSKSSYEYQLEGRPKKEWFARELLQPVKAALKPSAAASRERDDYEVSRVLEVRGAMPSCSTVASYPTAERTPDRAENQGTCPG